MRYGLREIFPQVNNQARFTLYDFFVYQWLFMLIKIKRLLASAITNPLIGEAIAMAYRNRIPSHGLTINTQGIIPRNVAMLYWGLYEKAEIQFIKRYLRSDLDVIELGASIGIVSAHICRKLQGRRLICVEPNRSLLETIHANITTNAPGAQFTIVPKALYYGDNCRFVFDSDNTTSRTGEGVGAVAVETITLSEVINTYRIKEYTLVSDCEGSEAEFLVKDSHALRNCKHIIIELHDTPDYSVEEMNRLIKSLGFNLVASHGAVSVFNKP